MTTEPTTEPTTTDQQTEPTGDVATDNAQQSWRELPGAKALADQARKAREEARAAQEQLAALHAAQKAAEEKARAEQLAAAGQWEQLAAEKNAEIERIKAEHSAKERSLKLEAKLAQVSDDLARDGIIARCPADADIDEYVSGIREKRPDLFAQPGIKAAAVPAQGGQSGGKTKDWSTVKADINSGVPFRVQAAVVKLREYRYANDGKYPPGWD